MFSTVSIGDVIIHAIEGYGFYSALVVVCVLHGIVSALDLGYNVKRARLRGAVFLAGFGAMGDCGYGAVLISAIGEVGFRNRVAEEKTPHPTQIPKNPR